MSDTKIPIENHGVVTLCSGGCGGGCPKVNFNNTEHVLVTDDFGGKVKIPHAEWQLYDNYVIAKYLAAQAK